VHAVGIAEPEAVECAEVLDGAVGGAPLDESTAQRLERLRRIGSQGDMIEVAAVEHRRQRVAVGAVG
jgi:hypothetical protein